MKLRPYDNRRSGKAKVLQDYVAFLRCVKAWTFKRIAGHLKLSVKEVERKWAGFAKRAGTSDPLAVLIQMIERKEVLVNRKQPEHLELIAAVPNFPRDVIGLTIFGVGRLQRHPVAVVGKQRRPTRKPARCG